ncbi:dual-specificity kinase, putative [Entamoeba histolytica HM-3:IMSS]|uniref:Dual-specificity kinase, putative n=1 Tax=Entamoeba histolytica HM-3:IMSS TaxID=885315 RepID=M7W525_ENTHI|nr:dual-specificity kinase, putative [Entamoeba histolytica HM-3:IMSS]
MSTTTHHHRKRFIKSDYRMNYLCSQDSFFTPFTKENRSMSPGNDFESSVRQATITYIDVLKRCNPNLDFSSVITKRALTSPSTPAHNDYHDNCKYDYILYTDEVIGTGVPGVVSYGKKQGTRYRVLCLLGQGAFGQVVKCFDEVNKTFVAIKVLKNRPAYYRQAMLEIAVLQVLNEKFDVDGRGHTLRLLDHFVFHNHVCIVTELLSINLYELMKQNNCRALFVQLARSILQQLLEALVILFRNGIIHCDLKPENVLLIDVSRNIKLIDFGSACFENSTRKRPSEMKNKDDVWAFKSKREFEEDNNIYTEPNREYFTYKTLEDIAMKVAFRVSSADEPHKLEMRVAFLDFLKRALQWDPEVRMRPDQALQHPFITKTPLPSNYTLPPTTEPLRSFPPGTQLTTEEVLQKIAPNPAAAQKLRTMGYNATTYYQVYADGLSKGIVLNILNSNPFFLQPMTPPALIRINQQEEEKKRRLLEENKGNILYQGIGSSTIQQEVMKNRSLFKEHSKKEEHKKQRRQTGDVFSNKGMETLSPRAEDFLVAQSMKIDQQQATSYAGSNITLPGSTSDGSMAGSWSTQAGMLLPGGTTGSINPYD